MTIEKLNTPFALHTKRLVDEWMTEKGYPVMSTERVVEMMGGIGDDRCKTVEDALARPSSNPGRWFTSGMKDDSFYSEPAYVYDNWFVANVVSAPTYELAGRIAGHNTVYDVGGTIFNAMQLLAEGVPNVWTVNLPNTPAFEFYDWCIYNDHVIDKCNIVPPTDEEMYGEEFCVFAEFFEHFPNVDDIFVAFAKAHTILAANAFCVAAHGHYIPITIDGLPWYNRANANVAFLSLLEKHGFTNTEVVYKQKYIVMGVRNSSR